MKARTFAEWWHKDYAWEHYIVGVLLGFLLGAMLDFPFQALLSSTKPIASFLPG